MPDTPSITLVKRFYYRGAYEEWTNRYHFSGSTPGDAAAWKVLADAVFASEKTCLPAVVELVRAYGYEAGSNGADAVIEYDIAPLAVVPGTLSMTGATYTPGDVAFWIRWPTPDRARGKVVYLRKYLHGALRSLTGPGTTLNDAILPAQATAALAHGAKMIDGSLPGAAKVCGPQGAVAGAPSVSPYLTTRTLKRRGKRNPT